MDNEQKYREALERAKSFYDNEKTRVGLTPIDLEYIFPELKEVNDEQSKRWVLEYLHDGLRKSDEQFKNQFKCAIAWLERQVKKDVRYKQDVRYKHLEELLAADDIYQMSMNQDMVEEAKTKAINALSKLCISELLLENQNHDGKKWIYEDVFYLKEKEQLIQDGIDEVLENPEKYGLVKKCEQKSSSLNGLKFGVGDIVKSKSQPMLKPMEIKSVGEDCYYCEGGNLIGFAWENDYEIVEKKELSQSQVTKISDQEWSEEDEELLNSIIKEIESELKEPYFEGYDLICNKKISWLKSLKQRLQ